MQAPSHRQTWLSIGPTLPATLAMFFADFCYRRCPGASPGWRGLTAEVLMRSVVTGVLIRVLIALGLAVTWAVVGLTALIAAQ